MISSDLLVIGAGPAGLFAAIHCKNLKVTVLEKNAVPGKKLLISGTGRCNLTHDCNLSSFSEHYGIKYRFLKAALHEFSNNDLIHFFEKNGLATKVDKNGKVFPASQNAGDVLKVLLHCCARNKVEMVYNQPVIDIEKISGGFNAKTSSRVFTSKNVLLTTGGMSYPATGSTGDGYHLAKVLGHSVVPPKPSLSPVYISNYTMADVAGVSVQNKTVYLYRGDKKITENRGDIGFTHKGLSGPGILDLSRHILSGDILKLNFADMNPDDFRKGFIKASDHDGKTAIQTYLKKYNLARSLLVLILKSVAIEPETRLADINRQQRNSLVLAMCEFSFKVEKVGGFNIAMVTAGGVSLEEVNPKTMESKLVPGLYFAGELLDFDGDTGGYNLQAAFSTGFLVAKTLGERV